MTACDVELIRRGPSRQCRQQPARPYTASCRCGHEISGNGCESCLRPAARSGCLACWQKPGRHYCAVTVQVAEEVPA